VARGNSALPELRTANWESWVAALEAMEAGLAIANDAATWDGDEEAPAVVWIIPDQIGPLPASLRGHASRLLSAQGDTIRRLEGRRDVTGRHLTALRSIPSSMQGSSVYLDVTS
jgi:hypothetical protein